MTDPTTWCTDDLGFPARRFTRAHVAATPETADAGAWIGNRAVRVAVAPTGWVRMYEVDGWRAWHDRVAWAEVDGADSLDHSDVEVGTGVAHVTSWLPGGIVVERLVVVPDGDARLVLCRLRVRASDTAEHTLRWFERWPLRPRWADPAAPDGPWTEGSTVRRYTRSDTGAHLTVVQAHGRTLAAGEAAGPAPEPEAVWFSWLQGAVDLRGIEWVAGERALSSSFDLPVPAGGVCEVWSVCGTGAPDSVPGIVEGTFDATAALEAHVDAARRLRSSLVLPTFAGDAAALDTAFGRAVAVLAASVVDAPTGARLDATDVAAAVVAGVEVRPVTGAGTVEDRDVARAAAFVEPAAAAATVARVAAASPDDTAAAAAVVDVLAFTGDRRLAASAAVRAGVAEDGTRRPDPVSVDAAYARFAVDDSPVAAAQFVDAVLAAFGVAADDDGTLRIAPPSDVSGGSLRLPTLALDVSRGGRRVEGSITRETAGPAVVAGRRVELDAGRSIL